MVHIVPRVQGKACLLFVITVLDLALSFSLELFTLTVSSFDLTCSLHQLAYCILRLFNTRQDSPCISNPYQHSLSNQVRASPSLVGCWSIAKFNQILCAARNYCFLLIYATSLVF